jgi:serine/threonine/tyrosine protein kinase RAD53
MLVLALQVSTSMTLDVEELYLFFTFVVQDFVRCLLEEDPKQRMTMQASLNHPWLRSYTPIDRRLSSSTSSIPTFDYSMMSSIPEDGSFPVNQDFRNMQIQPSSLLDASTSAIPGAYPNTSAVAGIKREDSKVAPLQRRSHVLSQAAEDGKALVEPSWEMVAAATAQDNVAGPSNSSKGQNKRVHSELTPLSEEASMYNAAEGSSPLSEVGSEAGSAARGKGRASGPAAEPAKAKSSRARGGKSNETNEDEAVQPRRSGRHPPKVARRG